LARQNASSSGKARFNRTFDGKTAFTNFTNYAPKGQKDRRIGEFA